MHRFSSVEGEDAVAAPDGRPRARVADEEKKMKKKKTKVDVSCRDLDQLVVKAKPVTGRAPIVHKCFRSLVSHFGCLTGSLVTTT